MKKICLLIISFVFLLSFSLTAKASEVYYEDIFSSLSDEAAELLKNMGIDENAYDSFGEISPSKAISTVVGIFKGELTEPLKTAAGCIAVMMVSSLIMSFLPASDGISELGKRITLICVMFILVSFTGELFTRCASSLLVTEDFMLTLIPIAGGIAASSGNPSLALSFNTVAFSFAEIVSGFFNGVFPLLAVVMTAVACSAAINPVIDLGGVSGTLAKCVNLVMAFVSGIFVAVMSVRGVIAGAADTVTIRGFRFLIGNSVPVVGSAIGEALNSVVAGLGLIKNTVGMIGIAAVAVINLPVLIEVAVWKGVLHFLALSSDILGISEIKTFMQGLNAVMSVLTGAICFVSFVFIISIAILITVGRS